jgi:hypothetical protein
MAEDDDKQDLYFLSEMSSSLVGFIELDDIITRVLTSAGCKRSRLVCNAPQYLQDLLTEIGQLGILTRHGAKMFPSLSVLDGAERDRLLSIIRSVNDIFVEIHGRLQYTTGASMSEAGNPEEICRAYCSRLKDSHVSLAAELESLQRFALLFPGYALIALHAKPYFTESQ